MWLGIALALFYVVYLAIVVPTAALAAGAAYCLGVPARYFIALGRVLVVRPPGLPAPWRQPRPPASADPAVLQYFYGPAMADAEQTIRAAYDDSRRFWDAGAARIRSFFRGDKPWITRPLGVGGAAGMAMGTAAGAVAAAGCALIQLVAVGISATLVRATGATLRGADSAFLRVKNIRMVCPACSERVPYPGYVCPGGGCARRHRDVRPGRFGIMRRRCQCGTRMNTLLLFGSSRMAAFCPHCGHPLEHRPGEAPEIVLPFFGATGAGKTRLLFSIVTQLQVWSREGQLSAEFADSVTTRELDAAERVLRSGSATAKTPVQLPRAHVIRVSSGKGTRILHMFDAAGERFYHSDRTQELGYLGQARTFILVIDPLSVEAFWGRLPAGRRAELGPARSTAPSPDLAYQQTHQEIEAMGVPLRKARLAVVFSRADLIGTPDGDPAEWARCELGLGNLIRSADHSFKETCFFHTAAVMKADGAMDESVAALMRWVLAGDGVALPGDGS
jgi:double-GTPase-like protein